MLKPFLAVNMLTGTREESKDYSGKNGIQKSTEEAVKVPVQFVQFLVQLYKEYNLSILIHKQRLKTWSIISN